MALSQEQFNQLKDQLKASQTGGSSGLPTNDFQQLKNKLRQEKEIAEQTPASKGKMFSSFVNKADQKAKDVLGEKSFLYKATLPGKAVSKVVAGVADVFTGGTQKFGATAGAGIASTKNMAMYDEALQNFNNQSFQIQQAIRKAQQEGKDTSRLEFAFNELKKTQPKISDFLGQQATRMVQSTPTQNLLEVGGQALGSAVEATGVGTLKGVAKGKGLIPAVQQKGFLKTSADLLKQSAPFGYAMGVSRQAQEQSKEQTPNALKTLSPFNIETGLSVAIPIGIAGISSGVKTARSLIKPNQEDIQNAKKTLEESYIRNFGSSQAGKRKLNAQQIATDLKNKAGTSGSTPFKILADDAVVPNVKQGQFRTFEQAETYKNRILDLSSQLKRAVAELDYSAPSQNFIDLEDEAIRIAKSDKNIASGEADDLVRNIKKSFASFRREYGESIPASRMDEIKSARFGNVNFNKNPFAPKADRLSSDADYLIGKTMQKRIEKVAKEAGFEDLAQANRDIGDRIEAARFLATLDGKTIKGGFTTRLTARILGGSIPTTLPGRVLGAIGGDAIANALISESVTPATKRLILAKIAKEDPESFQAVYKWLDEQGVAKTIRKALPEPSGIYVPPTQQGQRFTPNQTGFKTTPVVETKTVPASEVNQYSLPKARNIAPAISTANKTSNIPQSLNNLPKKSRIGDAFTKEYTPIENAIDDFKKLPPRVKQGGYIANPLSNKADDITKSIQKAKASGQSFDEWVKGQKTLYHGSNENIKVFSNKKGAQGVIWFTDNPKAITAGESGAQGTKFINERVTTGQKFAGWDEYEKLGLGQIEDMGFDGIKLPTKMQDGTSYNNYILFNNKTLKTRSQLKAEWDKIK